MSNHTPEPWIAPVPEGYRHGNIFCFSTERSGQFEGVVLPVAENALNAKQSVIIYRQEPNVGTRYDTLKYSVYC